MDIDQLERDQVLVEDLDEDDDDEEDYDDNQHNTPLIADQTTASRFGRSKLRLTSSTATASKRSQPVKSTVNPTAKRSGPAVSFEESTTGTREQSSRPARTKSSSKKSLNTPPPITIGKIKIFNPRRAPYSSSGRHRLIRIRRFLKRCFTCLLTLLFLALLLYNLNRLPELIRSVFGRDGSISSSSSSFTAQRPNHRKDQNSQCEQVVSSAIWRQNFPMLVVESGLRPLSANNDSVIDLVVPFGTGIDSTYYDPILCQIYFNQTEMESKSIGCGGGVMAIDGSNGQPIWAQYSSHRLTASNCNADLNNDGLADCVLAGSMASLMAVDGQTGALLWSVDPNAGDPIVPSLSFFTPLLVPKDIDGDSVSEMIVMHGGDALHKSDDQSIQNVARMMVVSGKTGRILSWSYVPDGADSSYPPQLLVQPDGTSLILFGTGSETRPGALYVASLDSLLNDQLEHGSRVLFQDCCRGVITPPALVDLNQDGILDIVLAHFNSTVMAFDGLSFERLWQTEFEGGHTYSTPSVGYFNHDNVPDFGVFYQFSSGYSEFNVLDGSNGRSLLRQPLRMQFGSQSSPLAVSTFAYNDIFLYWHSACSNSTIKANSPSSAGFNHTSSGIKSANSFNEFPVDLNPFAKFTSQKVSSGGPTTAATTTTDLCRQLFGPNGQPFDQLRAATSDRGDLNSLYDSRTDEPIVEQLNYSQIAYQWYQQAVSSTDDATSDWNGQQNSQQPDNSLLSRGNILFSPEALEKLSKYKKWQPPPPPSSSDSLLQRLLFANEPASAPDNLNIGPDSPIPFGVSSSSPQESRYKRAVMASGQMWQQAVTRPTTASTGTLVPSIPMQSRHSPGNQLPVDGSIDLVFATYSPPPPLSPRNGNGQPSSVGSAESFRKCVATYLNPEKEMELRVMDDNSLFKRLGYDHQQYADAVNDICLKEQQQQQGLADDKRTSADEPNDPVLANDWLRVMGSSTLHRVKLTCFDRVQMRQVAIKEQRYQWWPSHLGLMADSVANLVDD